MSALQGEPLQPSWQSVDAMSSIMATGSIVIAMPLEATVDRLMPIAAIAPSTTKNSCRTDRYLIAIAILSAAVVEIKAGFAFVMPPLEAPHLPAAPQVFGSQCA